MALLIAISFFTAMILITYLVLCVLFRNRIRIVNRVDSIVNSHLDFVDEEFNKSIYERLLKPSFNKSFDFFGKITPGGYKRKLDEKVRQAGYPLRFTSNHWLALKAVLPVALSAIAYYLLLIYNIGQMMIVLIIVLVSVVAFFIPEIFLNERIKIRKGSMGKALPEVIDLLTVSVEAGLSFDGALARVVEKMEGELIDEFNILLREIRMGKSRKDSLRRMAIRCDIEDLTTFISSVSQADELGVSISNVLRIQSTQIKEKRKQKIQEEAMKAPLKILFPLVLFIFPTIFVILLGPALIKIIETFV